eukprot:1150349-Pelagomonas_calceolata.AAC.5
MGKGSHALSKSLQLARHTEQRERESKEEGGQASGFLNENEASCSEIRDAKRLRRLSRVAKENWQWFC